MRILSLALLAPWFVVAAACAGQPDDADLIEDMTPGEGDEKADGPELPLTVFDDDIGSVGETKMVRLITKASSYVYYFGHAPPASVNFDTEYVFFYSAGLQSSGGYEATVPSVKLVNGGLTLMVTIGLKSPGPDCTTTAVITKPYVLVKFPKPDPRPTSWTTYRADTTENCSEPSTLLEYRFGNQIYGSTLEVKSDGSMIHTERNCCPPNIVDITEDALAASELASLVSQIDLVQEGTLTTSSYTNAEGAQYGELTVFAGGQEVLVREYLPGTQRVNTSTAAIDLVQFVNGIATRDMP